jgi:hypothetical protein
LGSGGIFVAVGNKDDFFPSLRGNGRNVIPGKAQDPGKIRRRVQGVHQKDTADDGFHISHPFYPAGYFQFGRRREGDEVEGIADS